MLIYNSENECYSRFIPIDQAAEIQEKIKKLETRLQNMPVNPIDQAECTDELDIVWLNDSLLLIAEKDAVVQGRTLNRAFYRLPVNNETDKKSADVKNTVHNIISNNDLESLKPERIFAGNLVVLKIESTSDRSNELVDIIDEDIEFIESVLRPIERIYAGVVYLKKEKDLGQKSVD